MTIQTDKEEKKYSLDLVGDKSLYLNNYRISGPKPWGGGNITKSWTVTLRDLKEALGKDVFCE